MTHTKQFIEDAVAGGYVNGNMINNNLSYEDNFKLQSWNPDFWKAVGKTRGWDKGWLGAEDWKTEWSIFIDHMADGKTIEEALAAISE